MSVNRIDSIKAHVGIVDIIQNQCGVELRKFGREYKALCPFHNEKSPSFTVVPDKAFYKCFGCGAKGDVIDFVAAYFNISLSDAIDRLSQGLNFNDLPKREIKTAPPKQVGKSIDQLKSLYATAAPSKGTLVETYWQARGIDTAKLSDGIFNQIRFAMTEYWHPVSDTGKHARLGMYPTQIAPIQNDKGQFQGVHLTYLAKDGSGKAKITYCGEVCPSKKMRGIATGGAVRLGPASQIMGVSEGIENALSILSVKPDLSIWVATSLNNLSGRGVGQGEPHPNDPSKRLPSVYPDLAHAGFVFPSCAERVFVFTDNDSRDPHSANALFERAFRKFHQMGCEVVPVWPPKGMDFNNLITRKGQPKEESCDRS